MKEEQKKQEESGKRDRFREGWESVKQGIFPVFLSVKESREVIREWVTRPFLDLTVSYILVIHLEEGTLRVPIKKKNLENWGISEETIFEQAKENQKREGVIIRVLSEVLEDFLPGTIENNNNEDLYLITNREYLYGASCILIKEILQEFANRQGRNLYMFPSSIHEMILLPEVPGIDWELLNEMVLSINQKEVREVERLVDHVYFFDRGKGEIQSLVNGR